MESKIDENDIKLLHVEIQNGNLPNVRKMLSIFMTKPQCDKHFINVQNFSAAATALKFAQIDIYELLVSQKVFLAPHEDIESLTANLSLQIKRKLREIHKKHSQDPNLKHIKALCSKSSISHDASEDERRELLEIILQAFELLNTIEWVQPILKVVACAQEYLKIIFDFSRGSIVHVDPTTNKATKGICYLGRGDIYIGAKGLLGNEKDRMTALGTLIHELTHYAMQLTYGNSGQPFCWHEDDEQEKFKQIMVKCELKKKSEPEIDVVFDDRYKEKDKNSELIVRVPHLIAQYLKEPEKLKFVKETFSELVDFFEQKTLNDLNRELPLMEARTKLNELSLGTKLRQSEMLLKEDVFKINFSESEKFQIVTSNCCQLTMNAIFHAFKDFVNFELGYIFVSIENLDRENLELLTKAYLLVTNPKIIIDCDGKDETEVIEIAKSIRDDEVTENIIFIVRQSFDLEAFPIDFDVLPVVHKFSDFKVEFQNELLNQEVNFQGFKMFLEDVMEVQVLDETKALPLDNLIDNKLIAIGKEINFKEIGFYFERKFLPYPLIRDEKHFAIIYDIHELLSLTKDKQAILFFDEPGFGKSTELKMMTKRLKNKFQSHWVVFIDLKEFYETYERDGSDLIKFNDQEAIVNFLCENILQIDGFDADVFRNLFRTDRVVFLMDGFDEIAPSYKDFVAKLLKRIRETSKNTLWVSTRPHFQQELSNVMSSPLIFNLEPITYYNRMQFYEKFLMSKTKTSKNDLKLCLERFRDFLKSFESNMNFIENPLILKMVVEIFAQNPDLDSSKLNKYSIYEQFTTMMVKKCVLKGPEAIASVANQVGSLEMVEFYQKQAFELLYPINAYKDDKNPPHYYHQINELVNSCFRSVKTPSVDDIARVGLMYVSNSGKFFFLHRTFAEFFIPKFIFDTISGNKNRPPEQVKLIVEAFAQVILDLKLVMTIFLENALESFDIKKSENFQIVQRAFNKFYADYIAMRTPCNWKEEWKNNFKNLMKCNTVDLRILDQLVKWEFSNLLEFFLVCLLEDYRGIYTDIDFGWKIFSTAARRCRNEPFLKTFFAIFKRHFKSDFFKKVLLKKNSDGAPIIWFWLVNRNNAEWFKLYSEFAEEFLNKSEFESLLIDCLTLHEGPLKSEINVHFFINAISNTDKNNRKIFDMVRSKISKRVVREYLLTNDKIFNIKTVALHSFFVTQSEELHYFCTLMKEYLENKDLKEFFCSRHSLVNDRFPPRTSLMDAAMRFNKDDFEFFLNFSSESYDIKDSLLQKTEKGESVFHFTTLNSDVETFNFIFNLYREIFGNEKVKEIIFGIVKGMNVLVYALDYNCYNDATAKALWDVITSMCDKSQLEGFIKSGGENKVKTILSADRLLKSYPETYDGLKLFIDN